MGALFLSYARSDDEPFVRRLHDDLAARGLDVWFDRVSMPSRGLQFTAEIERAIAERERFVLVVGPRALASAYVTGEWRCALRLGKAITPVIRAGSPGDLPAELHLLDARDFTADARYDGELTRLLEQIAAPLAPLGRLIGVPALPPHFIEQPERLAALKEALRADLLRASGAAGGAARAGVHGMGGIGKSVLACAAANDAEVRRLFPDGIVWVPVGQEYDLVSLLRGVVRALGEEATFADEHEGRDRVRAILEDRAVLLVLDDVWDRAAAEAFRIGPRCRLLITTRDASLVTALGGREYQVQLPTLAEAASILAEWSGRPRPLPDEAAAVIRACGRLPLALAICGAMVRDGTPWGDLLDALREADLEFLEHEQGVAGYEHHGIFRAIKVGVDALPEGERARWRELAVFPPDRPPPEDAVLTLWAHTGKLPAREGRRLLAKLERRSLLLAEANESPSAGVRRRVVLHDLLYDYAVRQHDDLAALHGALLDAYAAKCPEGWPSGPDDGYFLQELARHLVGAGRGGELADLLGTLDWPQRKADAGLCLDLPDEYRLAAGAAPAHELAPLLPLVGRAIGRDAAFIAAHPKLLLQCVWHTGWWHDAPEAEAFYEWATAEAGAGAQPPWRRAGPKLHELVHRWRARAAQLPSAAPWLRSLRPPAVPLESPLVVEIPCYGAFASDPVSITADGSRVAGGGIDGTVHVWDAASGREIVALRRSTTSGLKVVALSPDGERVAAGHDDGAVALWGVADGKLLVELPGVGTPLYSSGAVGVVSPDGAATVDPARAPLVVREPLGVAAPAGDEVLVAVYIDRTAVRAGREGAPRVLRLPGDVDLLRHAALSADGRIAATAVTGGVVRVWDASVEGEEAREIATIRQDGAFIKSVALSPRGDRLAVGTDGGVVRLIDVASGADARAWTLGGAPHALACSADARHVAAAPWSGEALVWNATTGALAATFAGHESGQNTVALSADGRTAATGTEHAVRVWDAARAGTLALRAPFRIAAQSADCIRVSDAGRIVFATIDALHAIDAERGAERVLLGPIESAIGAIDATRDGCIAATVDWDGEIQVIDVERGQVSHTLHIDGVAYPDTPIGVLSMAPDASIVVTSSEELGLAAWDVASGRQLWKVASGESWWLGLALSDDGAGVWVPQDEERRVCRRIADGTVVGRDRCASERADERFAWPGGVVVAARSADVACVHTEGEIIPVRVEGPAAP